VRASGSLEGHEFALCLTHDVDRPYKTYQSLYYALQERDPPTSGACCPAEPPGPSRRYSTSSPNWALPRRFTSSTSRICSPTARRATGSPGGLAAYAGRYDIEPGDHLAHPRDRRPGLGRSASPAPTSPTTTARCSPPRSATSRTSRPRGARRPPALPQHRTTGDVDLHQRAAGLQYDATPGSSCDYGFHDGYDPTGPSTTEFVVFPLTLMECALPGPGGRLREGLANLRDVADRGPRPTTPSCPSLAPALFQRRLPGYDVIYRRIVERGPGDGRLGRRPGDAVRDSRPAAVPRRRPSPKSAPASRPTDCFFTVNGP